ncbi:unnamed protein product [Dracunculus medinensis]|uniref:RRM domain-containing protein n=1 Tax=Dracunculus medinensis TaxID=318479 RepID=A0A0N4U6F7_DRAME|nr:unnamed protein product [Dracunculus medinensis]
MNWNQPEYEAADNQCGLFDNNSSGLLPIEDTCGSLERMIQSNRNFFLDDISRSSAAMTFNSRNSQDSNISTMNDMKLYEVRKADEPIYSRKVFVGGLPRDFNASELFFSA